MASFIKRKFSVPQEQAVVVSNDKVRTPMPHACDMRIECWRARMRIECWRARIPGQVETCIIRPPAPSRASRHVVLLRFFMEKHAF